MFIGFLESNLAVALLLLVLLLTCGMMALKIKSWRGAGGRAQRLPTKALGGSERANQANKAKETNLANEAKKQHRTRGDRTQPGKQKKNIYI